MRPHAVSEFANEDLDWLIHRQIYLHRIDVVQLEYTPLGQYAHAYRHIPTILFEHDIYFQSIARGLAHMPGTLARDQGALRVSAGVALRVGHAAALRPGAGVYAGKRRISGRFSAAQKRASAVCKRACGRGSTPRATISRPAGGSRSPCCFWEASGTSPTSWRWIGS
jgi:hypothetical protein